MATRLSSITCPIFFSNISVATDLALPTLANRLLLRGVVGAADLLTHQDFVERSTSNGQLQLHHYVPGLPTCPAAEFLYVQLLPFLLKFIGFAPVLWYLVMCKL